MFFIDGLKLVIVLYTCFHFVPILRKIWHFSIFYFAMVKLNLFCVLFPVSHDGFLQDDCNNQKASKNQLDGYQRWIFEGQKMINWTKSNSNTSVFQVTRTELSWIIMNYIVRF